MKKLLVLLMMFIFFGTCMLTASGVLKMTPELKKLLSSQSVSPNEKVSVIIRVKGDTNFRGIVGNQRAVIYSLKKTAKLSQKKLIEYLRKNDSDELEPFYIVNAVHVVTTKNVIYEIAKRNDVEMVYHDDIVKILPIIKGSQVKTASDVEWNVSVISVDKVRRMYGLTGKGIVVGHIDTGIDANHSDLKGKVLRWKDCISNKPNPYDDNGHGTHTAGTIAGGNKSGKYIGMAPDAKLIVAKVFSGSGSAESSDIMEAMEWMLDPDGNPNTNDAPRLVSNSWGSSSQTNKVYWEAVQAWVNANIFPCFAAGNSGPRPKTVGTPGGFPHSFAVGATDNKDNIAYFSSRGPISWDGIEWIKPDVSAPGKDITSSWPGGGYNTISGTSMACPATAGVIALLYQADPNLSIDSIRNILESTSKDLGSPGKDQTYGSGRINAYKAIIKVLDSGKLQGNVSSESGIGIKASFKIIGKEISFDTDDHGKYNVSLKEGKYKAIVTSFGYLDKTVEFEVIKKKETILNVFLETAPKAILSGIVKNESGEPLKAKIYVEHIGMIENDSQTGKYQVEVPYGKYQMKVSSWTYATEIRDGVNVNSVHEENFTLKKLPPVLVVDDDKGKNFEEKYTSALDDCKVKYTYFEYKSGTEASLEYLGQYPVLIWFTGKDSSTTLTESDQKLLTSYLNAGGNLFIAGQDIGYDIKLAPFYKKMLHVNYLGDNSKSRNLNGINSNPISKGIKLDISGDTPAFSQSYPDYLKATDSKPLFNYETNQLGAVSYNGKKYKVVYFGFGFEGIKGKITRKNLMRRITSFLIPSLKDNLRKLEQSYLKSKGEIYPVVISNRILINLYDKVITGDNTDLRIILKYAQSSSTPKSFGYLAKKLFELSSNYKNYEAVKISNTLLKLSK